MSRLYFTWEYHVKGCGVMIMVLGQTLVITDTHSVTRHILEEVELK